MKFSHTLSFKSNYDNKLDLSGPLDFRSIWILLNRFLSDKFRAPKMPSITRKKSNFSPYIQA
jgi:hypothetical protein